MRVFIKSNPVVFARGAFSDARTARSNGDIAEAERQLKWIIGQEDPTERARAQIELASLRTGHGRQNEGERLLREADKSARAVGSCELLLEISAVWLSIGHPLCSKRASLKVVNLIESRLTAPRSVAVGGPTDGAFEPNTPRDRYHLALAYFQLARSAPDQPTWADPEPYLEVARDLNDPQVSPFALLELAVLYARRLKDSGGALREVLTYDHPKASPEANFELAALVSWHRRAEQARKLFAEVRDRGGDPYWAKRAEEALDNLPHPPKSRITEALNEASEVYLASEPSSSKRRSGRARRVIIVGAGLGGQYLFQDLIAHRDRPGVKTLVIGFVDDYPERYEDGVPLAQGVEVLGRIEDLGRLVRRRRVHEVWIAMPSAPAKTRLRALSACRDAFVPVKTLPGMHELVRPGALTNQLRDVKIEDLTGEESIAVDHNAARWLRTESVFIVGCGAIGRQLAIGAARAGAERIVLLDRDEVALRELIKDLREIYGHRHVVGQQGTGVSADLMHRLLREHACTVMFHTASPGWARVQIGLEAEPNVVRTTTAIAGLASFVQQLSQLSHLRSLVWVSDHNVSLPNNHTRSLWAIAEAIMLGAIPNEGPLVRCAVRVPPTYTAGSGLVQDLRRDAEAHRCLRVPPPDIKTRFAHAHEVAQLVLHAGRIADSRAIYSLSCGEEQSLRQLAEMLLMLSDRTAVEGIDFKEDEALQFEDSPLPTRVTPTGIDKLFLLGRLGTGDAFWRRIRMFLESPGHAADPDLKPLVRECGQLVSTDPLLALREMANMTGR